MNRVLIHSIAFSPDGVSTAYLYNDIALKFKNCGYRVTVITTTPHFNKIQAEIEKQPLTKKFGGFYYLSHFNEIRVIHIPQKKFNSKLLRIIGFLYWHFAFLIIGLFEKKIDLIVSPSPPLSIGLINILLGKLKGSKVIYNVQEIYPDLLIEEGSLKSKTIIKLLHKLEKFIYNKSDAVVTIDQIFYNSIIDRFRDKSKLRIIPNFVDISLYKPINSKSHNLDSTLFPKTNSLKLMYAGNIGYAQDWETLILIAEILKDDMIEFFIIGEGVMKKYLSDQTTSKSLNKLHLLPYQPRELMPEIIAYSDIQFIFMSPKTEGHGFPSKVYTVMACEKPLLVSSGPNTPIINFLADKKCAFLIEEKEIQGKADHITELLRNLDKELLIKMGKSGYSQILDKYTSDKVTNLYVDLIKSTLQ